MTTFQGHFESEAAHFIPKDEKETKVPAAVEINEAVKALRPEINYTEKIEAFNTLVDDIEDGKKEERYLKTDKEIGVQFMGDPRSSFIMVSNESPMLGLVEARLASLNYSKKEESVNTVFSKVFHDRKASSL